MKDKCIACDTELYTFNESSYCPNINCARYGLHTVLVKSGLFGQHVTRPFKENKEKEGR